MKCVPLPEGVQFSRTTGKSCLLQAADMWAWSCGRTWLENDGTIPEGSYPVRWGKFGDIPQIILQWTAEDIDEELSRISEALGTSRQRDVTDPGRPDRTVP